MKKTMYLGLAFAAFSVFGIACSARELASSSSDAITGGIGESRACEAVDEYEATPTNGFAKAKTVPANFTSEGGQIYTFDAQGVGQVYVVDNTNYTVLYDATGAFLAQANRGDDGVLQWMLPTGALLACPDQGGWSGSSSSGWSGSSSSGWSGSSSSGWAH